MSATQVVTYQKSGATFSSGAEAYQNKNVFYSAELTASIEQYFSQMTTDGILLGPTTYSWDQATGTLTIQRSVSDLQLFNNSRTYDVELALSKAIEAGWTHLSTTSS